MKAKKLHSSHFRKALEVLRNGGVIAHATDTCYGFACNIFSKKALRRLYTLKKMSPNKPVSILVPDLQTAKRYGVFNSLATKLAKKYWPGPLTIIVPRKKTLPPYLNRGTKTIGIRVPKHVFSRKIARKLCRPITTTSANITKLPPPYSRSAIIKQFSLSKVKVDYILNSGRLRKNAPSTIVDVSDGKVRIIRTGSVKIGLNMCKTSGL